jgi:amino acid adenylation domain-containing protein
MQTTIDQRFRLSPQQRQLWLWQQGKANYLARCAVLIEGNLDPKVLEEALHTTIRRHEILRTAFHRLPGMKVPVQIIDEGALNLRLEVRPDLDSDELDEIIGRAFADEGQPPFELEQTPLIRASLLSLSDARHLLLLNLPSLSVDLRSLGNLVEDISRSYVACLRNEELTGEVTQYIQFSEWQNELLEDEEDQEGKTYWQRKDFSAHLSSDLPFELHKTGASFTPHAIGSQVDPAVRRILDKAAQENDTTVEVFLLACWQTLLWRFLRKSEMVVGQVAHGRSYEELHSSLGVFARELPIQIHFEEDSKFSEILKQCAEATRAAAQWQDYFSWPRTPAATTPDFFPFAFEFSDAPQLPPASSGLRFSLAAHEVYAEPFKLKLCCSLKDAQLRWRLEYDAGLFERAEMQRLLESYAEVVRSAAGDAQRSVGQLRMLGERGRAEVLEGWNETQSSYPAESCLHELIEAQAERTPEAVAVVSEAERLSYRELEARANQLAHLLRSMQVGPESTVALFLERSLDFPVAMLATLKAGAAFLPLDPAQPQERLSFMLRDAGVQVVLTQESLVAQIPDGAAQLISLDADQRRIALHRPTRPDSSGVVPGNLAYVIYTSGSTGQPKGVAVEHRQIVNYVQAINGKLALRAQSGYATVSTFAADLGHTIIFPALCAGGTLHIISQERSASTELLADYCTQHRIDCLKIVPSHLAALLNGERRGEVLPVQRLVLGGEAASWALIEEVRRQRPACAVLNHYGPTETTVGVLTYEVEAARESPSWSKAGPVPLGGVLENVRAYILDERQQPVPVWVGGELYLGGKCLTRGYINGAEQTAERYVPDPFSTEAGARLYRTGDRARHRSDGAIEYLGRVDRQVKIRGYRIELGEVESVLRQHKDVRQCVAVAREEEDGEKRLIAYIVGAGKIASGAAANAGELRNWMSEKLPEYMIPGMILRLDAMPLTANGKVNLQALPSPDETHIQDGRVYVAPETQLQEVLAEIWADILKVERVGILDNFFELGGHSLLAMRILSRIRETFRVELQLRLLLEATTIKELADSLSAYETKPGQFENIARLLKKIKGMSAAEIKETLQNRKTEKNLTI